MSDLNTQEYDRYEDKLVSIFTYTRADAISDGEQMLLTGELAQIFKGMCYIHPVYITRSVINLIEAGVAANTYVSWRGILHDLAWMSVKSKVESGIDYIKFNCYMVTADVPEEGELMQFYFQVGATDFDDPAPCMTLMTLEDR